MVRLRVAQDRPGRVFAGWKPVSRQDTAELVIWLNSYFETALSVLKNGVFRGADRVICDDADDAINCGFV